MRNNANSNVSESVVTLLNVLFGPAKSSNPKAIQFSITIKQTKEENLRSWGARTRKCLECLKNYLKLEQMFSALIQRCTNYWVQKRVLNLLFSKFDTCTRSFALFTEFVKQRFCLAVFETVSKRVLIQLDGSLWGLVLWCLYRRLQDTNTATPQTTNSLISRNESPPPWHKVSIYWMVILMTSIVSFMRLCYCIQYVLVK